MKNLKRLFALLLAVAMVMSMAVTVSATEDPGNEPAPQETDPTGTITITGAAGGVVYEIYRIFDIERVGTSDTSPNPNVYTPSENWLAFLKGFYQDPNLTEDSYITAPTWVNNPSDSEDQGQLFAQAVVKYAEDHNILPDGKSQELHGSGIYTTTTRYPYGYYVMVSGRTMQQEVKYTVFALDADNITIQDKNDPVSKIEKTVKEKSTGTWGETNHASTGEEIEFKIEVTVAANSSDMYIRDTMPNFIIDKVEDIHVSWNRGGMNEADREIELDANKHGFTVKLVSSFVAGLFEGEVITVSYKAKLTDTPNTGKTIGNVNTVVLDNDKNLDNNTGLPTDSTTTYTYQLEVTKVDENNKALAGAKFQLHHNNAPVKLRKTTDSSTNDPFITYVVDPNGTVETITTEGNCKFRIVGLDDLTTYVLKETEPPTVENKNYIPMPDDSFTISGKNEERIVENLPGASMPETGGTGTTIFYIAGGLLTAAALILLVTKKRMGA